VASSRRPSAAPPEPSGGEAASPSLQGPISEEEAAWLESLRPWATAIALRRGLGSADAEDAVQVAFLIAVDRWSLFALPPGHPERQVRRQWVATILWRVSAQMGARRDQTRQLAPCDIEGVNANHVSVSHESQVLSRDLLCFLEQATTSERWRVWVSYQLENVPVAELARRKGCPAATIYNLLRLARLDLGAALRREAVAADGPLVSRHQPKPPA
jgi:DNA-directed RNA polymerase specialized sigma24 family protein